MTCVSHKHCPEWLDTRIALRVIPDVDGAYVDLLHDGFSVDNMGYVQCVEAWNRRLKSLKAYCETGRGMPHANGIPSSVCGPVLRADAMEARCPSSC